MEIIIEIPLLENLFLDKSNIANNPLKYVINIF